MKSCANINVNISLSLNSGLAPGLPFRRNGPFATYQSSTSTRMIVNRLTMSILVMGGSPRLKSSGTFNLGGLSLFHHFHFTLDILLVLIPLSLICLYCGSFTWTLFNLGVLKPLEMDRAI